MGLNVDDATISLLVTAGVVVLFVWGRFPVEVVAMGSALVLFATGVITVQQAVSGFGDPAVVLIASLFIVSEGLDSTGVTTWAGQALLRGAGTSRTRLVILMMLVVALMAALVSITGAVAALLPMVVVVAVRIKEHASKLLMPLAFGASAGSMLTLTGTPANVIVSDAANDAGEGRFGYFEFAWVGIPLVIVTVLLVLMLGDRLLPERHSQVAPVDLSQIADTVAVQYRLRDSDLHRLRVRSVSDLAGRAVDGLGLADDTLRLIGAQRPDGTSIPDDGVLRVDDVLVVRGTPERVGELLVEHDLALLRRISEGDAVLDREVGLSEVVVPPRSPLVGVPVFAGMQVRGRDVLVLAVQRQGSMIANETITLQVGDTLLVSGAWEDLLAEADSDHLLMVHSPEAIRRQAVPFGPRARRAVAVLAGMVLLLSSGVVPPVVASLLAAGAMIVLGVLNVDQALRAVNWPTVVLIGALFPLSIAIRESGAGEMLATRLVDAVAGAGVLPLIAALFLFTAVFSQLISNTATALFVAPIAVSAAATLDISAKPLLMTVAVGASAAFLTPVSTPGNMMVMGPAGYRFGDYWKLGLPLLVAFLIMTLLVVPVVWPL
jgi:di/tricarboxylate transporter